MIWKNLTVGLVAALACCSSSEKSKANETLVKENLLTSEPTKISHPSGAILGESVVYLGCDVDTSSVNAGASVTVTHYYKVVSPPGKNWKLFTHVVGEGGEWSNADNSPMRQAHPVGSWKAGQLIADRQIIAIDAGWSARTASIRVGLFNARDNGKRMSATGGLVDSESRVIAAEIAVAKREAFYTVKRTTSPIEIDGETDAAWKTAPWSDWFVTAKGGKDPVGRSRARLLWDDTNLYALIEVEDTDVFSPFKGRDDTLWKADVVELFIDADGNRRGYVELQVNPNNAVFDAWFPKTRAQKHHFEWNSKLRSAVKVRGTAGDRSDVDRGFTAEIAIPHQDVKGMDQAMAVATPPAVGDRWRLNVIRVDKAKGAKSITASSWNPITIRDFHALGRMLTVVFGPS